MKRTHPLFSPLGIGMTLAMLLGLGFSLLSSGGLAFNPGKVSATTRSGPLQGFTSHADFESECKRCHQPLATTMDVLCLNCHTRQAEEIKSGAGVHGGLQNARNCAACHSEHKGRDYNSSLAASTHFDHSKFTFVLDKHPVDYHSQPISCSGCHGQDASSTTDLLVNCTACHRDHDPQFMQDHLTAFGQNCLDCHDGADRMVNFDHTATGFSLEGQHASLRCTDCHLNGQFKNTPSSCQGCHREPDAHRGLFAQTCADCHTSAAWSPAHFNGQLFSHDTSTPFSLVKHSQDYAGAPITCKSCHTSSTFQFEAQTCIDCHGGYDANFMTSHRAEFGDNCIDCHDGSDRLANFDHSTFFVLDGKHAEIGCTDCHQNHVFKGTPADCSSCHTEPDIHKGFFGLQCQDCHTTSAWHPARLLSHAFPLDHGGSTVECQTCHPTTYDQYTCYGCHEHQEAEILGKHLEEGISQIELPECVRCHPTGREHD